MRNDSFYLVTICLQIVSTEIKLPKHFFSTKNTKNLYVNMCLRGQDQKPDWIGKNGSLLRVPTVIPEISLSVGEWVLDFMNRDYCMYLRSLPLVAIMLKLLGVYC